MSIFLSVLGRVTSVGASITFIRGRCMSYRGSTLPIRTEIWVPRAVPRRSLVGRVLSVGEVTPPTALLQARRSRPSRIFSPVVVSFLEFFAHLIVGAWAPILTVIPTFCGYPERRTHREFLREHLLHIEPADVGLTWAVCHRHGWQGQELDSRSMGRWWLVAGLRPSPFWGCERVSRSKASLVAGFTGLADKFCSTRMGTIVHRNARLH
jgi:hypothetical protein